MPLRSSLFRRVLEVALGRNRGPCMICDRQIYDNDEIRCKLGGNVHKRCAQDDEDD